MRNIDGVTIVTWAFWSVTIAALTSVVICLVIVLFGTHFSVNTPTYCYVDWRGAEQRYEYKVYQHRTFGPDNTVAAVRTYEEAAHAIELLCH